MNNPFSESFNERQLEILKAEAIQRVSEQALSFSNIDLSIRRISDELVMKLEGCIWGEEVGLKKISYPSTWIDAFKVRWFPEWALNRWPAKYTTHVIDVKAVYPDFKSALPGQTARKIIYRDFEVKNDD